MPDGLVHGILLAHRLDFALSSGVLHRDWLRVCTAIDLHLTPSALYEVSVLVGVTVLPYTRPRLTQHPLQSLLSSLNDYV